MASFQPACEKKPVSTSAPCNFVREAKRLLDEAKAKKAFIENCDNGFLDSERTAEYYDLIDATVADRDALEILRLRHLLRESLKTADDETRLLLKEECSSSNKMHSKFPDDKKSASKVSQSPTSFGRGSQSTFSCVSRQTKKPASRLIGRSPGHTAVQDKFIKRCNSTKTLGNEDAPDKKTESHIRGICKNALMEDTSLKNSVVFSKEFMLRAQQICPAISGDCIPVAERMKVPCAVPLAPPNRNKATISAPIEPYDVENIQKGTALEQNVSFIELRCCEKPVKHLSVQKLKDINIIEVPQKTFSAARNNKCKTYKISSLAERKISLLKETSDGNSESSETSEILNSEPVPDCIASSESENLIASRIEQTNLATSNIKLGEPATNHKHVKPAISHCKHSKPMTSHSKHVKPSVKKSVNAVNKKAEMDARTENVISRLADALRKCKDKLEGKSDPDLNRKSSVISLAGPAERYEDIQGIALDNYEKHFVDKKTSPAKTVTADVAVQVSHQKTDSSEYRHVSSSTHSSPKLHLNDEKYQQASLSPSHFDTAVQTDLQGLVSNDIVIKGNSSAAHAFHSCCTEQHSFPQPSFDMLRSSTPLEDQARNSVLSDDEDQCRNNLMVDASVGTDDQIEFQATKPECKTKDIGIQLDCNHMEINLETRDEGIQMSPKLSVTCGTVTSAPDMQDVSVQSDINIVNPVTQETSKSSAGIDIGTQTLDKNDCSGITSPHCANAAMQYITDNQLSEGEVKLPLNSRLLSLIENHLNSFTLSSSSESNENQESGTENMLSEGEIPPSVLQTVQIVNLQGANGSSSFATTLNTTDTSLDFIPQKLLPDSSAGSVLSTIGRKDQITSETVQGVNLSHSKSSGEMSSGLSGGGGQMLSEGEIILPPSAARIMLCDSFASVES